MNKIITVEAIPLEGKYRGYTICAIYGEPKRRFCVDINGVVSHSYSIERIFDMIDAFILMEGNRLN